MPRLSVVMPMRNAAETIEAAARSTLRAMPNDSELVVVDDASTDTSLEVLDAVRDRRIRVLRASEPLGVARALNLALADVDCELVGRMDADDVCLPWRFARQLPRIGPRCDVSFGQAIPFRRAPVRVRVRPPVRISPEAMPLHLVLFNPVHHPTMVAAASALRAMGGYRTVPAEDYDLWMRLAAAGHRLERLGLPVMLAREHRGQVTAASAWQDRPPLDGDRSSYHALCRAALGQEPTWDPNPRRNPQSRARLDAMAASIRERSRQLPAHERRFLDAKVRSVVALAVDAAGSRR